MGQVSSGVLNGVEPVFFGLMTRAELDMLREDKPHPVAPFPTPLNLPEQGVNISEFEQLHQTAKSSGMLTQDDVDAYLAQSEPNLSDDELSRLSGFDEPGSIEGKPTDLGSDPFATPTELPKRQRGLSAHQTPFFTQSDTFSEASFGMSSGSIQTVSEHDESSAETSKSPSSSESSADLALGESEDTIID